MSMQVLGWVIYALGFLITLVLVTRLDALSTPTMEEDTSSSVLLHLVIAGAWPLIACIWLIAFLVMRGIALVDHVSH